MTLTHNSARRRGQQYANCSTSQRPLQVKAAIPYHCKPSCTPTATFKMDEYRKKQLKVRLDRRQYPNDPEFTRAFTATELDDGITALNNGKAAGLDDIQTELIIHISKGTELAVLRFFNNCTESKKVPKLWRHATCGLTTETGEGPIRGEEFPVHLPALSHVQTV